MAKTSILTIMIQLARQGDADRHVIKNLAQLKQNVGLAIGAFTAFAGAGLAVGAALGKTVSTFVDYAAQVRELSRLTGTSAEETSRLIQVADDATISYESLQKALLNASKNGIEVNIDSLAALSDEYNSLGSATEQTQFLLEKFGKSGAEMGKMMEMGSSGIRAAADATSGSLVLTDAAVQSAREYEIQVDTMNDQFQALKVTVGQGVVPVLNEFLFAMNNQKAIQEEANRLIDEGVTKDRMLAGQMAANNLQMREYTQGLDSAGLSYRSMAEAAGTATGANLDFGLSLEEISQKNQDMLGLIMNLQSETDTYNQKNDELKTKLQELTLEQSKYHEGGSKWKEIQGKIDETKGSITALADEHEAASQRIVFSLLQQKLAADGLSNAEFAFLLKTGEQWGIIDEKVAQSAAIMDTQAQKMADSLATPDSQLMDIIDKINNLESRDGSSWDFYVAIHASGGFTLPGGGTYSTGAGFTSAAAGSGVDRDIGLMEQASGGQMGAGWKILGEEGFEIVSPTGYVFTHEQSRALLAAGIFPENAYRYGGAMEQQEAHGVATQLMVERRNRRPRNRGVAPPSSGGGGGSNDAVMETVSTATEVAASAANASVSVQQQATHEAVQTRATIEKGNADMLGELQEIKEALRQQQATMERSIVAAVQQAVP